jgi:hypothetical protein
MDVDRVVGARTTLEQENSMTDQEHADAVWRWHYALETARADATEAGLTVVLSVDDSGYLHPPRISRELPATWHNELAIASVGVR